MIGAHVGIVDSLSLAAAYQQFSNKLFCTGLFAVLWNPDGVGITVGRTLAMVLDIRIGNFCCWSLSEMEQGELERLVRE